MPHTINNASALLGRFAIAAIFLWSGYGKLMNYAGVAGYMQKFGVPDTLLPFTIALELFGGILLIVGWKTRYVAIALAGFTIIAAVLFHSNFGDRNQLTHFMKNIAMAGGLLFILAHGAGRWSLDHRQSGAKAA